MSYTDTQAKAYGAQSKSVGIIKSGKAKRVADLLLAVLLLPVLLPVIAVLYVLTRLDGGPGFFGHRRIGENNKEFKCWKIRSMVHNAEAVLEEYLANNPEAKAEWERDFKLTNDPRITKLGRILRETSLDELPQIWNVLRGEMSFVGPRPVTAVELEKYQGYEWCYLSVKPGITGLWQVSGRNDVDYAERVQLDMQYATNRSMVGDFSIIFRTAGAVLNRTGR